MARAPVGWASVHECPPTIRSMRERCRSGFGPVGEPEFVRRCICRPREPPEETKTRGQRPTPTNRPIATATDTRVRRDVSVAPAAAKPTPINAHTIQSGASHESFDTASVTTTRATVPSHRSTARGTRVFIQPVMGLTIAKTLCLVHQSRGQSRTARGCSDAWLTWASDASMFVKWPVALLVRVAGRGCGRGSA